MNLKFSSRGVRLRVSLEEARVLANRRQLAELIAFPEQGIEIEIRVTNELCQPASFYFSQNKALAILREREFLDLLKSRPARDLSIQAELSCEESTMKFVFEIDLFSRKATKEARV